MSPDDPRHGTVAGYSLHMRTDKAPCEPCRVASTEARKERRKVNPGTPRPSRARGPRITPFLTEGYDPDDGLTGGRWMRKDGSPTRVWVQTTERHAQEGDEGLPVPQGEVVADPQAVVCPCGARAHERCRTAAGAPNREHRSRLTPRCCPCGAPLSPRKSPRYCDDCREKARLETYRAAYRRRVERRAA